MPLQQRSCLRRLWFTVALLQGVVATRQANPFCFLPAARVRGRPLRVEVVAVWHLQQSRCIRQPWFALALLHGVVESREVSTFCSVPAGQMRDRRLRIAVENVENLKQRRCSRRLWFALALLHGVDTTRQVDTFCSIPAELMRVRPLRVAVVDVLHAHQRRCRRLLWFAPALLHGVVATRQVNALRAIGSRRSWFEVRTPSISRGSRIGWQASTKVAQPKASKICLFEVRATSLSTGGRSVRHASAHAAKLIAT